MLKFFLPLAALLLLCGCTPEPPAPLRIGTCIRIGCEQLYLARDLGYYGDAPVRIVEYSSATEVLRAFRSGALDAVAVSLDEAMQLAQNTPLRVVLVMNFSNGADVILGQPNLKTFADIKGKRVGVESTALGAYVLARALQLNGMKPSDIHVVYLPIDEQKRAFEDKRVDAVVTFEPVHSELEAAGAHHLFDSKQLPGEMVNVIAVRKDYLERYPGVVEALLRGWFKSVDYFDAAPRDATQRMATDRALPPQQFHSSLKGFSFPDLNRNLKLFTEKPPLKGRVEALSNFMLKQSLIHAPVTSSGILDAQPLIAIASGRRVRR
ncbi:MAG TPA: ABC transporter substrate-binding protein [Sulfuriferula sp.]|nr:ABC transporter substrate-binding protein [Sulfuriferula sp.]